MLMDPASFKKARQRALLLGCTEHLCTFPVTQKNSDFSEKKIYSDTAFFKSKGTAFGVTQKSFLTETTKIKVMK